MQQKIALIGLLVIARHGEMQVVLQDFCKFKVASRINIFILQKTKKHISLKKRFGRKFFISRKRKLAKRYW
jgi:hypothetical protein